MITDRLRSRRRASAVDVNITPLIDVVFLLLIFFMVSATFDRYSELRIELPRADAQKVKKEPAYIDLTIDRQGRYYVNKRAVVSTSQDILERALKKALGSHGELPVVISADGRTPHQAVITAMEAASRVGLVHVAFAVAEARPKGR